MSKEIKREMQNDYATIVDRFSAIMVDTALLTGITVLVCLIGGGFLSLSSNIEYVDPSSFFILQAYSPITWITATIFIFYYTYFEGTRGQTVGKIFSRIKVVDSSTGEKIQMRRAFLRSVSRLVDFLPVFYIIGIIFGRRLKEKT